MADLVAGLGQLAHDEHALCAVGQKRGLGPDLRATFYEVLSRETLLTALEVSQASLQFNRHFHLAFLAGRYASVKQFSGQLLAQLHFAHAYQGDDFAQALALVADLHAGRRRKLPEDVPQAFMTPTWTRFVRATETGMPLVAAARHTS